MMVHNISQEIFKFRSMLSSYPSLLKLWDFSKRYYDPDQVDLFLDTTSNHNEALMLQFFLSVWRKDEFYDFNLVTGSKTLLERDRQVIIDWLKSPYYP